MNATDANSAVGSGKVEFANQAFRAMKVYAFLSGLIAAFILIHHYGFRRTFTPVAEIWYLLWHNA
jgi:hypothetical protein